MKSIGWRSRTEFTFSLVFISINKSVRLLSLALATFAVIGMVNLRILIIIGCCRSLFLIPLQSFKLEIVKCVNKTHTKPKWRRVNCLVILPTVMMLTKLFLRQIFSRIFPLLTRHNRQLGFLISRYKTFSIFSHDKEVIE